MPKFDINKHPLFVKHKKTLKRISKDSANDSYMTKIKAKAVDFDALKDEYIIRYGGLEGIRSNDALLEDRVNHVLVFVEFKNGNITDPASKKKLREKIFDSMAIFTDLTNKTITYSREHMEYVLVYNDEKNHFKHNIKRRVARRAKQETIHFGLAKFKHYFFKDVHTYTKEEFNRKYSRLL